MKAVSPPTRFAFALAAALALGGCGMFDWRGPGGDDAPRQNPSARKAPPEPIVTPTVTGMDALSGADRRSVEQATARALASPATGVPVPWTSPSGNRGTVTPTSAAYKASGGRTCRDYQVTVRAGGRSAETFVGTGCRRGGQWRTGS